jgi:hypothetical protein
VLDVDSDHAAPRGADCDADFRTEHAVDLELLLAQD